MTRNERIKFIETIVLGIFFLAFNLSYARAQDSIIKGAPYSGKDYLRSVFEPGSDIGIMREDSAYGYRSYWLCNGIRSNLFSCWEIRGNQLGVNGRIGLEQGEIRKLMILTDQESVISRVSGDWDLNYVNEGSFGGSYSKSETAGSIASWITFTDAKSIGAKFFKNYFGGFAIVSIDGDRTRARLLKTAQEYIDLGLLDVSALRAYGGTLEPNDRLVDTYSQFNADESVEFADNLELGVHYVEIKVTGYKRIDSKGYSICITGVLEADGKETLTTNNVILVPRAQLNTSATYPQEYGFEIFPTGAEKKAWVGNSYGFDVPLIFEIKADGVVVDPPNNKVLKANESIVVSRVSSIRHPYVNDGWSNIANMSVIYQLIPKIGLDVEWIMEMKGSGEFSKIDMASFSLNSNFSKGSTLGSSQDVSLNSNDDSVKAISQSDMAWAWDSKGQYAFLLEILNAASSTNNWTKTASGLYIQDLSGSNGVNRVYFSVFNGSSTSASYQDGDILTSHFIFRNQKLDNTELSLARVDDVIPPLDTGAPSFGTTTASSIEVVKPGLVRENGILDMWEIRRDGNNLGWNSTSTNSIIIDSLLENTRYEFQVRFSDGAGNVGEFGSTSYKYTSASKPENLTYSSDQNSITLTVKQFKNDGNDLSGYYFSRGDSNNSGWVKSNSWKDTGLSCNTSYSYNVKYRNGDGVETEEIGATFSTANCGGGGGGSGGGSSGGSSGLPVQTSLADINRDRKVDILDFVVLMADWNKSGGGIQGDINRDGKVNILDFVLLMANWNK